MLRASAASRSGALFSVVALLRKSIDCIDSTACSSRATLSRRFGGGLSSTGTGYGSPCLCSRHRVPRAKHSEQVDGSSAREMQRILRRLPVILSIPSWGHFAPRESHIQGSYESLCAYLEKLSLQYMYDNTLCTEHSQRMANPNGKSAGQRWFGLASRLRDLSTNHGYLDTSKIRVI